jgi:8-oxo-dGTP diphosphatase
MTPWSIVLTHGTLPAPGGSVKRRLAVRAVVWQKGRLLMIRSEVVGDWKFPGGGVEHGERPLAALTREVAEETGYRTVGRVEPAGMVIERSPGRDLPGSLFEMESRYFWTLVAANPGPQKLDRYERDLGFVPEWVVPQRAFDENTRLQSSGQPGLPTWLARETLVLDHLLGIL